MKSPFTPNANGLVILKLIKGYGSNIAGDTAGFLPEIAKSLVQKGYAQLPGHDPVSVPVDAPVVTTRSFRPAREPLNNDSDSRDESGAPADKRAGLAPLRDEYKAMTGQDADARWGEARLKAEIAKAKDPSPAAVSADG